MYSSVVVYVETDPFPELRIELAAELSYRMGARLFGVSAAAAHPLPASDGIVIGALTETELTDIEAQLRRGQERFHALAAKSTRAPGWRSATDLPTEHLVRQARLGDLIVIGRESLGDMFCSVDPGELVLRVGRPVLLVPPTMRSLRADRIVVGWKDTREARRAVRDALPLLARAQEVIVLTIAQGAIQDDDRQASEDMIAYLAQHKVAARAELRLGVDRTVADELIGLAARAEADLIVAGAYGRGRFTEWVLGGVTRDFLDHCPVACLLSH